ncbi:DNA internalization-related competence protein ComEC/Rec2 [Halalkalibacterium halodurans]|uniref:DNA internalization-related competence protein ComEC/Rec2 n=1 Tax=Halalkalibacterium halodurans TaxID=86665 RepID=UPI0006A949AF|nr:DNA internalization-related competence protein ComEC/Rec2 [Halalkalibacterium halodurans]MED3648165.1 DNA internalization-related competence protein ComEC/Rec2 [Halalkalibacterium halodurans]MED4122512.1 DNA internalization-related competence protein ComEC/Rec2 [Halalkalibacterium halodurans]TES56633.1 DNA internalization-related competence protein ComEC/Rec2 [Halalkalibacterium halodurans]TPE69074.1 DNA internalization-related competence protein ComEC/Rec2 [Halalkalibacterium halodurans]
MASRIIFLFSLLIMLGLATGLRGFSALLGFLAFLLLLIIVCQQYRRFLLLFLAILLFLCAWLYGVVQERQNETQLNPLVQSVEGTLISDPELDGDQFSATVKTTDGEKVLIRGRVQAEAEKDKLEMTQIGMVCSFVGQLEIPSEPTNPYQFNYRQFLDNNRIHWIFRTDLTQWQCSDQPTTLFMKVKRWRSEQLQDIYDLASDETAGLIAAFVYGDRSELDSELLSAYQSLGVIHLLAVSGLHVGLVVAAVFYLFIRLGVTRERAYELLLLFLPFYAIVAGAAPSVVRAVGMTMTVLLALRFQKRLAPIIVLSLVAVIYIIIEPYAIFQLGFQLSFLTTCALLLSSSTLLQAINRPLLSLVKVTFLAQLISMPVILYHFFELPILSVPLNLLFVPVVSFVLLPLSFFVASSLLIHPGVAELPLFILEIIVPIVHQLLLVLNEQSFAAVVIGKPSLNSVFLMMISLIIGWAWLERKEPFKAWGAFSVVLFLIAWQIYSPYWSNEAIVTMIDVGQGDSFLIELPRRKAVYMIDTGGWVTYGEMEPWQERRNTRDIGEQVLTPILKGKGIRGIDKLILTHGHEDHFGGAEGLVRSIKVDEVVYGYKHAEYTEREMEVLSALKKAGASIRFVKSGDQWVIGSSSFRVLSPFGDEEELNDQSVVVYAVIEGVRFLFTGDLEEVGEKRLLEGYGDLKADVLKVGHHGSATSTTDPFLEAVHPVVALISAGRNNLYGHPNQDVLAALEQHETFVLRTDLHGAVKLTIRDGGIYARVMTTD